jgi:hypothetical protein
LVTVVVLRTPRAWTAAGHGDCGHENASGNAQRNGHGRGNIVGAGGAATSPPTSWLPSPKALAF